MNQPYARVNQPYATLTLASALREMFGVQLYKNNARALLSRILSILNLDWLQRARSVRGVYELDLKTCAKLWQIPIYLLIKFTAQQCLFFNIKQVIAKTEGRDWRKFRVLRHIQEELNTPPAEMRAFCNKDLHSNAFTKNELLEYFELSTEEINEECMSKNTLNGKCTSGKLEKKNCNWW